MNEWRAFLIVFWVLLMSTLAALAWHLLSTRTTNKPLPPPPALPKIPGFDAFEQEVCGGFDREPIDLKRIPGLQQWQSCPVEGCRIRKLHSHVGDFIRRLRGE